MNEEENSHWHLKKEVSYGHLVTTAILLLSLLAGYVDVQIKMDRFENHIGSPSHEQMDRRVDALENEITRLTSNDVSMNIRLDTTIQQALSTQTEIIRRLERIEDRLNGDFSGKAK